MPPDWPRRTSSTPASTSVLTASRSVGRLIRMMPASSRSDGRRSPTCRSPDLIRSAICSTASSKVRRDETGSNELSKPTSGYPATLTSLCLPSGLHALERLLLRHFDRSDALGVRGLESRVEALHGAGDQLFLAAALSAIPLERYVDQATAVGEEVRHVDDVALHQRARDAPVGERVIGGARHHPAVDRARERVVDQAAGGAGREHVELRREDGLRGGGDLDAVVG